MTNMETKKFSVFYKDGDEANDVMLTYDEAMNLAHELEADDYDVIVCELENDEWLVCYDSEKDKATSVEMPWDYGKHFD